MTVRILKRGWIALAAALALASPAGIARAAPTPVTMTPLPARAVEPPAIPCDRLKTMDFSAVPDGALRVQTAEIAPAHDGRPEVCDVKGYVAPTIRFELRLPTAGYTGRYLQGGCGGNCGMIPDRVSPACDTPLAFGGAFAVGFEDSGHVGGDGVWALGGERVREDFAFRAAHAFSAGAKAVIAAYYGRPAARAYFVGCSDGGREAMVETQRYPKDFDGVIAGSPAFAITEAMERFLWEARVDHDAAGKLVIDAAAATALHAAVLKACDGLDGAADGQIDDPRACRFDPAAIQCRGAPGPDCLSPDQVAVARKLYQGPRDAAGTPLFYGGAPYGSELTWGDRGALANAGAMMFDAAVKDMVFQGSPPTGPTLADWRFDHETFEALRKRGAIYDANDPDLRPFRAAGGKLILWQGFADPAAGPYGLPDYYARLSAEVGGVDAARGFARMFLIPGVYHCGGGYMPYEEDLLGALVRWVEAGDAPDSLLATAAPPGGPVRRRPMFAYPYAARYVGHGDVNDPGNFRAVRTRTDDLYHWAGSAP